MTTRSVKRVSRGEAGVLREGLQMAGGARAIEDGILPLLPDRVRAPIWSWMRAHPAEAACISEIRLRTGQPVCLVHPAGDVLLDFHPYKCLVHQEDIQKTLQIITDCSYYALESEFSGGYITIPGGHRVGLSGEVAVWDNGSLRITEVGALCFRIAREMKGVARGVVRHLVGSTGRLLSTLIVSPPGCGKTTLLRDLCRIAGEGDTALGLRPCQVGIVDERSEIAACYRGVPQHDVGPRADVLDRCPKAKGIMMLLRSMGPEVIATDELGSQEDARAVAAALCSGASVLATSHGASIEDLKKRPYSAWLVTNGYFERVVILSRRNGPGTVEYAGEIK